MTKSQHVGALSLSHFELQTILNLQLIAKEKNKTLESFLTIGSFFLSLTEKLT